MTTKKATPGKRPRSGGRQPNVIGPVSFKVKALLEALGWSQADLVRATGIDQSTISRMTNKGQRPTIDESVRLAAALGVTLDYLIDDDRPLTADADRLAHERRIADSIRDPAAHPDLGSLARIYDLVREIGVEEATRRLLMVATPTAATPAPAPEPKAVTPEDRTPPAAGGEGSTYKQQKEEAAKKPRLLGGGGFKRKRYPFKG